MTIFWGLAAVMVIIAFLFVLPPLLRTRTAAAVTLDDLNTEVIKEQLAELDADLAAGKLDQSRFDAARTDLERELLYDLGPADNGQKNSPEHSGRWLTLLLIPVIPLSAVLLYQLLGSGEMIHTLQLTGGPQPEQHSEQSDPVKSLDILASRLAERLRSEPDNLQGWTMLAKTYSVLKRPDDAIEAYENIVRLGGGTTPDVLADYADAIVTANGGEFNAQAGELLLRALKLQPDHIKALWLTGHWRYGNQEYTEALRYWQMAAQQLPAGSADATVLSQQISMAQSRIGTGSTAITTTKTADAAPAGKSGSKTALNIHVALDPALQESVAPEDTVFIFARATRGPRMPLAIVRKQVKDLPVTVILDDSSAMSPQMLLSKFAQVTIGARISKTGNAMPRSGDLQGFVSPVTTQTTEIIQITINNKVP